MRATDPLVVPFPAFEVLARRARTTPATIETAGRHCQLADRLEMVAARFERPIKPCRARGVLPQPIVIGPG